MLFNILFYVITASYLLGREQKYTAGSVSSEGDSIFYSGISAVKSGSHVLKLYEVSMCPARRTVNRKYICPASVNHVGYRVRYRGFSSSQSVVDDGAK